MRLTTFLILAFVASSTLGWAGMLNNKYPENMEYQGDTADGVDWARSPREVIEYQDGSDLFLRQRRVHHGIQKEKTQSQTERCDRSGTAPTPKPPESFWRSF